MTKYCGICLILPHLPIWLCFPIFMQLMTEMRRATQASPRDGLRGACRQRESLEVVQAELCPTSDGFSVRFSVRQQSCTAIQLDDRLYAELDRRIRAWQYDSDHK